MKHSSFQEQNEAELNMFGSVFRTVKWVMIAVVGLGILGVAAVIILALLLIPRPAEPAELPADLTKGGDTSKEITSIAVYRQVAKKALRGEFGELQAWQEQGYRKLLTVTPTRKLAWITNYWPGEPGVNHTTASGRKVSSRVAAMLDQHWGTWVLIDLPAGYELRQVFDTGSRKNRHRAQHPEAYSSKRKPAEVWIDRCLLHRPPTKALRDQSWVRNIYLF